MKIYQPASLSCTLPNCKANLQIFVQMLEGKETAKSVIDIFSPSAVPKRSSLNEKPKSSLSLLLEASNTIIQTVPSRAAVEEPGASKPLFVPKSTKSVGIFAATRFSFSCEDLLEVIQHFDDQKDVISPYQTLHLFASNDDGSPDYDLPEFSSSTDVLSMGMNDFVAVGSEPSTHCVYIHLETKFEESISRLSSGDENSDFVETYTYEDHDGPDSAAHSFDDIAAFASRALSDERKSTSSEGLLSPITTPVLRIGKWVSPMSPLGRRRHKDEGDESPFDEKEENHSRRHSRRSSFQRAESGFVTVLCRMAPDDPWQMVTEFFLDRSLGPTAGVDADSLEVDMREMRSKRSSNDSYGSDLNMASVSSHRSTSSSTDQSGRSDGHYPSFLLTAASLVAAAGRTESADDASLSPASSRVVLTSFDQSESDSDDDVTPSFRSSNTLAQGGDVTREAKTEDNARGGQQPQMVLGSAGSSFLRTLGLHLSRGGGGNGAKSSRVAADSQSAPTRGAPSKHRPHSPLTTTGTTNRTPFRGEGADAEPSLTKNWDPQKKKMMISQPGGEQGAAALPSHKGIKSGTRSGSGKRYPVSLDSPQSMGSISGESLTSERSDEDRSIFRDVLSPREDEADVATPDSPSSPSSSTMVRNLDTGEVNVVRRLGRDDDDGEAVVVTAAMLFGP